MGQGGIADWVDRALNEYGDPEALARLEAVVVGKEREVFMEILARLPRETRDVSGVVRWAASIGVRREGIGAAAAVVEEVWARECCLRRSFLAAALDGVADGWEARGGKPIAHAGTALRLAELAENRDDAILRAARRAASHFKDGLEEIR